MEHMLLKTATVVAAEKGEFTAVISSVSVDREKDIVSAQGMVAAFKKWLPTGKRVPLTWHHSTDSADIVGHIDPASVRTDGNEVVADGWIDQTTRRGKDAWRLIKSGTLGFSFGYLTTKADPRAGGGRMIHELDIFEATATAVPMNADTRVLGYKGHLSDDELRSKALAYARQEESRQLPDVPEPEPEPEPRRTARDEAEASWVSELGGQELREKAGEFERDERAIEYQAEREEVAAIESVIGDPPPEPAPEPAPEPEPEPRRPGLSDRELREKAGEFERDERNIEYRAEREEVAAIESVVGDPPPEPEPEPEPMVYDENEALSDEELRAKAERIATDDEQRRIADIETKDAPSVGPHERQQLSALLRYYMKKPHPFTACVRDNKKRFPAPGQVERICATLKDIGEGTTKWRRGSKAAGDPTAEHIDAAIRELLDAAGGDLEALMEMIHEWMMANGDIPGPPDSRAQAAKAARLEREHEERQLPHVDPPDPDEVLAEKAASKTSPEPFSRSRTSNWVARAGGLPHYIQHIAHDLLESGRAPDESRAIQMAIGICQRWARGQGNVSAETRRLAAEAIAQWEKMKAGAKKPGKAIDHQAARVEREHERQQQERQLPDPGQPSDYTTLRITREEMDAYAEGGLKALWSAAYVNELPDAAFIYVEPGGKRDQDGKTVPRSLRRFPYRDKGGRIDEPHLKAWLRKGIPEMPKTVRTAVSARAAALLDEHKRIRDAEVKARIDEQVQQQLTDTANGRRSGRVVDPLREQANLVELEFTSGGESLRKPPQEKAQPKPEPELSLQELREKSRTEMLKALSGIEDP